MSNYLHSDRFREEDEQSPSPNMLIKNLRSSIDELLVLIDLWIHNICKEHIGEGYSLNEILYALSFIQEGKSQQERSSAIEPTELASNIVVKLRKNAIRTYSMYHCLAEKRASMKNSKQLDLLAAKRA